MDELELDYQVQWYETEFSHLADPPAGGIPSTCLEEARQIAARYAVDPEDLGYALDVDGPTCVACGGLPDGRHRVGCVVWSVIGDAQERRPPISRMAEFFHGGRYYRVKATDTQYPVLEIKGRRDGGGWNEVDPTEDMALYDAFVSAAESIGAMNHPDDRPTVPSGHRYVDPMDPDCGGGP